MKILSPSRTRRRSQALVCTLVLFLAGSCSSTTPAGCASPPPILAAKINSALSPLLGSFIRYSRNGAGREGTRRVPAHLQKVLMPYFDEETFDRARWTIATDRLGLGTVITSALPRYEAMTLEDTIVFRNASATARLDIWIHELSHVEQYARAGGAGDFSRQYLASWDEIEIASVRRTNHILAQLKLPERQHLPSLRRACSAAGTQPFT